MLPFLSPQLPRHSTSFARNSAPGDLSKSLTPRMMRQLPTPLPCVDISPESTGPSFSTTGTTSSSSSSAASLKERDSPSGAEEDKRRNGGRQPPTVCMQCHRHFLSGIELNMHFRTAHLPQLALEFDNVKSWKMSALEEVHHNLDQNIVKLESGESIGFQCPECHYFAKWPTELQKHIMVHSDVRPHICLICGSTYKWKWDLGRHFDKTHGGGVLMPNPYKKNSGGTSNSNGVSVNMSKGGGSNSSSDVIISRSNSISLPVTDTTTSIVLKESSHNLHIPSNLISQSNEVTTSSASAQSRVTEVEKFYNRPQTLMPDNTTMSPLSSILPDFGSSPQPTTHQYQAHTEQSDIMTDFDDDEYHVAEENSVNNDFLRARLKKKIQQSACKRRNVRTSSANGIVHEVSQTENMDETSAGGAGSLPYGCPMCGFRARWKSELKSHATNHTTCKPFLCPFCQYRSKWKWDVVKHMKRCNWKKHDGGPPSIGPPTYISNKEMQALIIYKPPAKEEITNAAEAMLYADENLSFYEDCDIYDEEEEEKGR